jgi:ATP-binding cassette subfamily B protein
MKEMKSVLLITGSFGAMMTVMNIAAFIAAIFATEHHLANIGVVYLVISYTLSVVAQLWSVGNITRSYVRIIGDAGPMISTLDEEIELKDSDHPIKAHVTDGNVVFDNVTFTHEENDSALFKNFSIDIKAGERIGLVGRSGSGKTTLTRLLLRFSDVDSGQIRIDSQPIEDMRQPDLRRFIAYVPQEPMLFHRSLRDNIAYGKPDATDDEIRLAAASANALEFIDKLSKGLDTVVGERGVKLSGGQRQRIAIARAILKDAPILLLDEATSALDSESEKLIQDALAKLMKNRTSIVIAHRLSTIAKLDRIIVLDDGKIVEQGTHAELLAIHGTYAKLWSHQSGGFIED